LKKQANKVKDADQLNKLNENIQGLLSDAQNKIKTQEENIVANIKKNEDQNLKQLLADVQKEMQAASEEADKTKLTGMVTNIQELIANLKKPTANQRELIELEVRTEVEYEKIREEFNNHKIRNEVKAEFLKASGASESSGASITKFSVMGMFVAILATVYP